MDKIRTNNLKVNINNDIMYITVPSFTETNLVNHCFSTRLGGTSKGIYSSMNLGINIGDDNKNVIKNFELLCDAININYFDLVFTNQVHDNKIRKVTSKDKGKGISRKSDIIGYDGLITNESKVPLVTFHADCVPLYFLDPIKKVIGLAHSGWKGTVNKIAKNMLDIMKSDYECDIKDILVAIGPSIGPCCFEVDQPVADIFINKFDKISNEIIHYDNKLDKYFIDLWKINKYILTSEGILLKNITCTDLCTKCNKDYFFSHRGHKGKRGSLVALMELR